MINKIAQILSLLIIAMAISACNINNNSSKSVINTEDLAKDILVLSSDSLQGRAPFTIGEVKTARYIEQRMKELGLEPVFSDSYFQGVPLVELTSLIPEIIQVQTPNGKISIKSSDEYTARCPILKESVALSSLELVFAGFGINAPEKNWNDFEGIDVKGKVIVVLVNDPDFYSGDTMLFKGKTMTYQGRWRYKFEEAERQGAAGCLIVHEEQAAGYPWSVTNLKTNKADFAIDDQYLIDPKCKLTGWITHEAAIKLFAACNMDYELMKEKASKIGFRSVSMNASMDLTVENHWVKSTSNNVAGFIKGTERPDEVIVYCAHWDHFGINQPINGDSIYNGASDNAAAVASCIDK